MKSPMRKLVFAALIFYAAYQNRNTQKILRNERDYLQKILNLIPLPLFITDKDRHLTFINVAALNLFQCEKEMIGQPCHCLHTCICNTPLCAIDQMERTGNGRTYYEMNEKSYMVSTAFLVGKTPQDGRYIELMEDITDVVDMKKILEEKTIELETMSENILGGVLITTMEEGYPVIRCNAGYRDMTGRSENQIVGHPALQWVMPKDALNLDSEIQKQLAASNAVSIEHRLHVANGTHLWVSLRGKRTILHGQQVGVWILTDISSIKEAELALRMDEERYRIAMQSTEDIIIDYDLKTHVMYHSSKAKEIYGVPEYVGNMPQSILDSGTVLEESRDVYLDLFRQLYANVKNCSCILKTCAADGRILWNRLTFTAIFDDEGNTIHAIGILQDITREKNIEFQHQRERRYLELSGKEGAIYYEADLTHSRFIFGHEAAVQTYCNELTDDYHTVVELLIHRKVYEPDQELVRAHINRNTLMNNYNAGITHTTIEYRRLLEDDPIWSECSIQCFIDAATEDLHGVGCIRNIDNMKKKELALQEKAEQDLLTGLYNKVTTELLIKNLTDVSVKDQVGGAFFLIDLDDFKNVNDTLGHAAGDEVLSKTAKGLHSLLHPGDIAGRIGGDEFAVYIHHMESKIAANKKAEQMRNILHQIQLAAAPSYRISGTIGIALFPSHGENFDELYKNADRALYHAKRQGKDSFYLNSIDT